MDAQDDTAKPNFSLPDIHIIDCTFENIGGDVLRTNTPNILLYMRGNTGRNIGGSIVNIVDEDLDNGPASIGIG